MLTLLLLIGLELVLGVDNILVISMVVDPFPKRARQQVRLIGLGVALFFRIGLILSLFWFSQLRQQLWGGFSGGELLFLLGGTFLCLKATYELSKMLWKRSLPGKKEKKKSFLQGKQVAPFLWAVVQIVFLDVVFSFDSVITALGMTQQVMIMIFAVICSFIGLLFYVGPIGEFLLSHPSWKILALLVLVIIGVSLVMQGFENSLSHTTLYTMVGFGAFYELCRMRHQKLTER